MIGGRPRKLDDTILTGDIALYVTVGAYIWAALAVLAALDPLYHDKIATIKDIASLLPLPGKTRNP
jgi:hypothetical protein